MTHHLEVLQKLVSAISKAVGLILLIVSIFILQLIFDMDYVCSCNPDSHVNDVAFMAAPPLILNLLVTLIDSFQTRVMCWYFSEKIVSSCRRFCCNFWLFLLHFFIKYVFLGGVWASAVLFAGEWYLCLMTDFNANHTGIPCKSKLSYEEDLIKKNYIKESVDYGLGVLCAIFLVWNISEYSKPWITKMMLAKSVCAPVQSYPVYYRRFYEELLSAEVRSYLDRKLKKIATKKAKKVCAQYLDIIQKDELKEPNPNGGNVTNSCCNSRPELSDNGNDNSNSSNDPSGNGNGNSSNNPEGNSHDEPSGNGSGNSHDEPSGNGNGNDNDNDNPNRISAAWQKISEPHFYLEDEALMRNSYNQLRLGATHAIRKDELEEPNPNVNVNPSTAWQNISEPYFYLEDEP